MLNETFIYLDHASTTYVYPNVIAKIQELLEAQWGNPSNFYTWGTEAKKYLDWSKIILSGLLGCKPDEIFFTSGASEGNAWGLAQRSKCLCSPYEHHSITANPKTIVVDEDYLERCKHTAWNMQSYYKNTYKDYVYAHMLTSNETGEVFNVKELFAQAKEFNMFALCDATQSFGNMKINVKEYGADMCVFSGHKFHAPKGVGFVYIDEKAQKRIKPLIPGTQQNGYRGGTENIAYIYGMALAAMQATSETKQKMELGATLIEVALDSLNKSGIEYVVNRGKYNLSTTLNFALKGVESEIIQSILSDKNIYIGVGSGCNNGNFDVSPTLKQMEVPEEYIRGPIRLSFAINNTQEEVALAMDEIITAYKALV